MEPTSDSAEAGADAGADAGAAPAGGLVLECWEGSKMKIPGGVENLRRAWYGDPEHPWEQGPGLGAICTDVIAQKAQDRGAAVACNAWLGCDPVPGVGKLLLVELASKAHGLAEEEEIQYPQTFELASEVPSSPQWLVFVRHAQAGHNADKSLLANPDNALTEVGRKQAQAAHDGPAGEALRSAELVITSPLTRAMETTALLLGPDDGDVRVMVYAGGSERWSAPCDEGRPRSELLLGLPERMRRWEGWDALPERWWAEPGEDAWERAEAFAEFVKQRPEERIALVGHGGFWDIVVGQYLGNCEHVFCDRFLS